MQMIPVTILSIAKITMLASDSFFDKADCLKPLARWWSISLLTTVSSEHQIRRYVISIDQRCQLECLRHIHIEVNPFDIITDYILFPQITLTLIIRFGYMDINKPDVFGRIVPETVCKTHFIHTYCITQLP